MIDELMIKPAHAPEKKLQPPARWVNWWRAKCEATGTCATCGRKYPLKPDDPFPNCCLSYPSKEVAEIAAGKFDPGPFAEWIGAFREGERP